MPQSFLFAYLIWTALMSLWTFLAYGWDKRRAQQGGSRVAEKSLHLLALVGGWPGAILGQQVFRHKTRKLSFQVWFWSCVVIHCGLAWIACNWLLLP